MSREKEELQGVTPVSYTHLDVYKRQLRYLITETIVRFLLLMGMLRLPAEFILQMNILMKSSVFF